MKYRIKKRGPFLTVLSFLLLFLKQTTPASAGDALLSWDRNIELDLAGYKVYYGTSPGSYGTPITIIGNLPTYTVTGLGLGTYYFTVTAYNTSGNESGYSNEVSKTFPDTTPPVISAINTGSISGAVAVITWATDEAATSQVEYGTTTTYGSLSALDPTRVTSHSRMLSGLLSSTNYHYRVISTDAAGNFAVSGDNTFTTTSVPDITPPVISMITAGNVTSNNAVITWGTDESATTQAEYGLTTAYGTDTPLSATLTNSHNQTLTGLLPNTLYHYRVKSYDAAGNLAVSGDNTFTTTSVSDATPPADAQNFTAVGGDQQITLSWMNPSDSDFVGVRIRFRTDRFPADINDGTLLGDFTGRPNQTMSTAHTGLQNRLIYYYSASSYDASGNYQTTVHASATPSTPVDNPKSTISGGCGMVFPKDGRPPGPEQAGDMMALLTVVLVASMRRILQRLPVRVSRLRTASLIFEPNNNYAIIWLHSGSRRLDEMKKMSFLKIGSAITLAAALLGCSGGTTSTDIPGNVTGTAILSWNPNSETDLAGYKVYYGTATGNYTVVVDVGLTSTPDAPQHTVSNLAQGNTYYFAVTAHNASGNESGYSNEVSKPVGTTTAMAGGGFCSIKDASDGKEIERCLRHL